MVLWENFFYYPVYSKKICGWARLPELRLSLRAVYMLWMYQRVMFGAKTIHTENVADLTLGESVVLFPLVVMVFWMGFFPNTFLGLTEPAGECDFEGFSTITKYMKKILKKIYANFPFKQVLFTLLKKVWTPSENIYQHLHFKGEFKVKINEKNNFLIKHYGFQIENELFWAGLTGGWEKESMKIWIELCKDADVIIDIGANTGVYSLIAKSMNPNSLKYMLLNQSKEFLINY